MGRGTEENKRKGSQVGDKKVEEEKKGGRRRPAMTGNSHFREYKEIWESTL
jgi:hypothetical protein